MPSTSPVGARIGLLVFATSGIQFANGFFGTFIALRVASEDFDATMAGLVLSSYFAGFTMGAFFSGRIIKRFGTYASTPLSPARSLPRPLPCRWWSNQRRG